MNEDNNMPNSSISQITPNGASTISKYPLDKKNGNGKKKVTVLVIVFVLALILAGVYYFVTKNTNFKMISPFSKDSSIETEGSFNKVMNPLTGVYYKEKDAENWMNERPIGFMINNYIDARPQSGLIDADLVYEVVAEGGITRFLAFFLTESPEKVGPIRSAREYYLVLVKELSDAMIMHWGFSPQAEWAIDNWPVRSLFRGGAGNADSCSGCTWRDTSRDVATEHTLYTDAVALRKRAMELGWEGKGEITEWKFKDDISKYAEKPIANDLTIDFWYEGDYTGAFKYDSVNNQYLRYTGYDTDGNLMPHKDYESEVQLSVKNVIVQFVAEVPIVGDDKNRLDYELVGSGESLVFVDGHVISATWTKEGRDDRTMFYDTDGNEMEFNRGKFWIAIVPDRNVDQVIYQ